MRLEASLGQPMDTLPAGRRACRPEAHLRTWASVGPSQSKALICITGPSPSPQPTDALGEHKEGPSSG